MRNIRKVLAAVAIAGAATAGFTATALAAPAATSQFTAYAESPDLLVTPVHLYAGEVIRQGLDGEAFTVVTESFNGGGTVFTVSPALPANLVNRTTLFTS